MTKKFPLTTFIKNVQSTIRKVGEFALNNVEYLSDVISQTTSTLIITLSSVDALPALKQAIQSAPPGRSRIYLLTRIQGHEVEISLPGRYTLGPETLTALQRIPDLDYRQV